MYCLFLNTSLYGCRIVISLDQVVCNQFCAVLYSSLQCDVLENDERSLRLLRAKSPELPKLLVEELLLPSPVRRPSWFPLWARDSCRRIEQRLQPRLGRETSPVRVTTSDAAAQVSGLVGRLRPPHYNKGVETTRVETDAVAVQTDGSLLLQPKFLLRLLAEQQGGTAGVRGRSPVPPRTPDDAALSVKSLERELEQLEPSDDEIEWWGDADAASPAPVTTAPAAPTSPETVKPVAPFVRRKKVLYQTPPFTREPPPGWGSWRNE